MIENVTKQPRIQSLSVSYINVWSCAPLYKGGMLQGTLWRTHRAESYRPWLRSWAGGTAVKAAWWP